MSVIHRIAIGDILRRVARRYPEKTALVDGQIRLSFQELDERCNRFAHYLMSQNLQKGDKIATICQNSAEFVITMFGIHKAGMVWVPVNPGLNADDVRYILEHSETKMVVIDDLLYANRPGFRELVDQFDKALLIPYAGLNVDTSIPRFESALSGLPAEEPDVEIEDRDLAHIMYTSGTTGRPKGVMQTHLAVYVASLGNIIEMQLRRDDVATTMMPLFHCAQHTMLTSFLHVGATNVILRGFEPVKFMETVERERITWVFALPVMYRTLLDHPQRSQYDLSSLRFCLYAMAPMDEVTLRRLIDEICPQFALASGQTEVYPATTFFRPEEQLRRFGSYWGETSIINDTAIMDEEGRLLPRGQIGEIVHRGPNVMAGYFKDPEATRESQKFGWHHTGDLGMFDQDGQLLFVDRKKDMIKTGGENVPSIKVEQVLLGHPAVANAAVVGLPHPRWSEAVTAFVTLKPGAQATEEQLIEYCKERLGSFEVPKAVRILDQFPMTSTGKIQKHVLRSTYRDFYSQASG